MNITLESLAQQVAEAMGRLAVMFPGQPIAMIADEVGIRIGVVGIELVAEDWFFRPATVEQVLNATN